MDAAFDAERWTAGFSVEPVVGQPKLASLAR
jgi:hypothetical protein